MALETQGFNIQPPTPELSQEYALTGLKPLSFSGGGATPVNIAPLAGWSVPSAHPESVIKGIGSGISQLASGIGQGIQAIYLDKQKKDALKAAQAREDVLLERQHQNRMAELGIHAGKAGKGGKGGGESYYVDDAAAPDAISYGTDENGNPMTLKQAAQDSDPNHFTSDDVESLKDRFQRSLPSKYSKIFFDAIHPNIIPPEPKLKDYINTSGSLPEANGEIKFAPKSIGQNGTQNSTGRDVTPSETQQQVKILSSIAPVPEVKSDIFQEPSKESAFRSNPLADLRGVYNGIQRFAEEEKNSRKEYLAGQPTSNTLQNLIAAFSKPKEQESFGGRFVNTAPAMPTGAPMAPQPAGQQPAFIANPPDPEDVRIGNLMRQNVEKPISDLAPYVSASNQAGPAGMQQLPINAAPENPWDLSNIVQAQAPSGQALPEGTPIGQEPAQAGRPQYYTLGRAPSPEDVAAEAARAATQDAPLAGPFRTPQAAAQEAEKSYAGYEPKGEIRWSSKDKGYVVIRPPVKERTLMQLEKAELAGLAYQNQEYNKDQDVTKIRSQHRMLNGFISAYETSQKNPDTRNISDLDMIDNYVAFARGAGSVTGGGQQVTEAQYNEIKKSKSVPLAFKNAIERVLSGQMLTQPERNAMLKTMLEAYNKQTKTVNNYTDQMRDSVSRFNKRSNIPETLLPHKFPVLRDESKIAEEKSDFMQQAEDLERQLSKMEAGTEEYNAKSSEYQNVLQNLTKLGQESSALKRNGGIPLNLRDLDRSAGWPVGLFPKGAIMGGEEGAAPTAGE